MLAEPQAEHKLANVSGVTGTVGAHMLAEPQAEHKWLEQLVGEWDTTMEASPAPGQPPSTHTGSETVRSLAVWVQCDGTCPMPDGTAGRTVMTLGFDPAKKRFVGTFVGSMMTHLWVYDGELDPGGKVLTLDADGPSFTDPGKTAKYKDAIEVVAADHRVMTSRFQSDDGRWHHFMTVHYRRKT